VSGVDSTRSFSARLSPHWEAVSDSGGSFVAECVELKVVSEGDTQDEALANLQEAVEGFLECADPSEVGERMHMGMQVRTFDVAV